MKILSQLDDHVTRTICLRVSNPNRSSHFKLDFREAIIRLWEKGWLLRAIARELGINRETAGRYFASVGNPAGLGEVDL